MGSAMPPVPLDSSTAREASTESLLTLLTASFLFFLDAVRFSLSAGLAHNQTCLQSLAAFAHNTRFFLHASWGLQNISETRGFACRAQPQWRR